MLELGLILYVGLLKSRFLQHSDKPVYCLKDNQFFTCADQTAPSLPDSKMAVHNSDDNYR